MALVTNYRDPIQLTRKASEDSIIKETMERAFALSLTYGVEAYKFADNVGVAYLVAAKRRRTQGHSYIDATYRNETAILNNYNMGR